MKFLINRTSNFNNMDDLKLSKKWNITEEKYDMVEQYDCKTFKEFDESELSFICKGTFISKGTNHKKTKNGIERTIPNSIEGQFIEINSLEDLISLQDECGDIIIATCMFNNNIKEIEIYDDYRE